MLEENNNNFYGEQDVPPQQPYYQPPQYNPYMVMPNPVEYEKKRDIRRIGLAIGIPAISLSVIGVLWSIAYYFVATNYFDMSLMQADELLNNPVVQQIVQISLSCLMFLLPFTIGAKCLKMRIDALVLFRKPKKGTFLPFLLFGMGFCAFSNIAMSYASSIFQGFGVEYEVNFGENPEGILGFLLSFITTAIVPALVEEFACRGIVLGLLKKYGEGFAIISSSIIFGIMHGNFEQIPFAVMVGLVLGYIYVKTKSIWTCVAVHCINNAISVIFTYLQNIIGVNTENLIYMIYLIFSMIVAIVGILLFAKNTDETYALEKNDEKITNKQKYTWLFTSWAIIVFLVLNIVQALSYFEVFQMIIYNIIGSAS